MAVKLADEGGRLVLKRALSFSDGRQHARVPPLNLNFDLARHLERLILLHRIEDFPLRVFAHYECYGRYAYAVNQVKAALQARQKFYSPGSCDYKLVHRDAPEKHGTSVFGRDCGPMLQHGFRW